MEANQASLNACFLAYLLHQLGGLGGVNPRPMFGAYGLYQDGVFFGIVAEGSLFLKTDELSVTRYHAHGMHPFQPNPRQILRSYYRVPEFVVDSPDELVDWAKEAIAVQRQIQATQRKRSSRKR